MRKLARSLLLSSGTQRGKRESAGRGGTGLAMRAPREPGAECRGTFGPFFLGVFYARRAPACRADTRDPTRSAHRMALQAQKNGASRRSVRCRRPTGSGTGGIRISPPGSAIQYRDTSECDVSGQACLACGQFRRLASLFRASDRDGILVLDDRYDAQGQVRTAAPGSAGAADCRIAASIPAPAGSACPLLAAHCRQEDRAAAA